MGVVIEEREPEIEGRKESRRQMLVERLGDLLEKRNGTPTGGSTCRWEENDGPTVDRFPRVGAVHLEHLMTGGPNWGHEWNQVKKKMVRNKTESGKRAKVREGGSASRTSEDQSSTDPGGGSLPIKERVPPWQTPEDDGGSSQWKVDGQEFPALGTQKTARKVIGSIWAGDRVDTRYRSPGFWTERCDRRRTFGQFGKGMFGRRVPGTPNITPFAFGGKLYPPADLGKTTEPTTAYGQ